ncbi:DNA ligase D, partial [Pseudomonas marginalis]|uniref:DNA ligase D n=3 Tax=Pseudomonas fluorescens group TaxID=136843 RepID=UPI001F212226
GLRSDKPAAEIIHEQPRTANAMKPAKKTSAAVTITHPDRVIDPQSGTRKQQLAQFYDSISQWILPFLRHRPVSLLRAPEGIEGEPFFQKHSERLAIPNIKHLDQALDPGHARLMEIDSARALIGAVQMGAVEFHTWGATSDKIETPDLFVLDLDPDPALPWKAMLEAAQLTLSVLDELGLQAFVKTSGGKGLHLVVPLARRDGWDTVKAFAKAIAQFMTEQLPERFTATSGPKNRVGKIFIDYLRNARGASTVAAYSVRARPGLPVSVPISREELKGLRSAQQWTVANVQQRLNGLKADPWAGYTNRQKLSKKMWDKLGARPPV